MQKDDLLQTTGELVQHHELFALCNLVFITRLWALCVAAGPQCVMDASRA